MMLRSRSKAVGSKQGLMADPSPQSSPTGAQSKPRPSSLFPSPRLFVGFSPMSSSHCEAAMSPTSILDTRQSSSIGNPFFDRKPRKPPFESIGLGLVDALDANTAELSSADGESRVVLFGSQLKIQIPSVNPISIAQAGAVDSPRSPIEFGIKNRDSQLALLSPARRTPSASVNSPRVFSGSISAREIELSEEYTCVITRGPNARTTHIFDNCILDSCGDGFGHHRL